MKNPERVSMLTPHAHLNAWFAEDKTAREQVLGGARKLDHRTADAIEILNKDDFGTRVLLETFAGNRPRSDARIVQRRTPQP